MRKLWHALQSRQSTLSLACGLGLQLEPALEALEGVMDNLKQVLDPRVYVALGRGLWDCTAREVFDYVEDLQEGDQHKVALNHLCSVRMLALRSDRATRQAVAVSIGVAAWHGCPRRRKQYCGCLCLRGALSTGSASMHGRCCGHSDDTSYMPIWSS